MFLSQSQVLHVAQKQVGTIAMAVCYIEITDSGLQRRVHPAAMVIPHHTITVQLVHMAGVIGIDKAELSGKLILGVLEIECGSDRC